MQEKTITGRSSEKPKRRMERSTPQLRLKKERKENKDRDAGLLFSPNAFPLRLSFYVLIGSEDFTFTIEALDCLLRACLFL